MPGQLTIFAKKCGAFSVNMVNLRGCFLSKCLPFFPAGFTTYFSNYLVQLIGIPSQECSLFEPQQRVELNFMYKFVSSEFLYRLFRIESDKSIDFFTQMMGTTSIFGVRKKMPRKDAEKAIKKFDLVNAISKIDMYI
jgi:hypothetical protein